MDFFNEINVNDNDVKITFVLGKSLCMLGKFKVLDFTESLIYFLINNVKYKIIGSNLNIKSLAKNEIIVQGNICGFIEENEYE